MVSKQVILVTGASTGFGRLITESLARRGHTVFATMRDLSGRNAANAAELRAQAKKESLPVHVVQMDVTDEASIEQAVRECVDRAGRIDVAINNAGYVVMGLEEAVTLEQARALTDTNFLGPIRVNRAVLPHMRRQHGGLLMHTSSVVGRIVIPGMGFYCASKFALEALAEAYHYELAGLGIESTIVEPGPYRTSVFNNVVAAADQARTGAYGPAGQIPAKLSAAFEAGVGDPQEVADVVVSIVETPVGQRQLRYRVSKASMGVDEINAVCAQAQNGVLERFGLKEETTFVKRSAATAS